MISMSLRVSVLALLALAAAPLPVAAQSLPSVSQQQVQVTPAASAYTAGNCLGGVLTVPNMVRAGGPGGTVIKGFTFVDPAGQSAANDAMTVLVFKQAPTGTYTDHAACALASADQPYLVGIFAIGSGGCTVIDSAATVCEVLPNLPVNVNPNTPTQAAITNTSLWFVPIIAATPTYGTTTLYFNFAATPYAGF